MHRRSDPPEPVLFGFLSKLLTRNQIRPVQGSKRTPNYEPPNQDNWSVTAFKGGWTLFCVHDGHGPYGHFVSTRMVQTVPWYLMECGFDKTCIESIDVLSKPLSITMETAYSRHCYLHCYGPPTLATADAWLVQKKARSFLQQRTTKFVVFRGENDLAECGAQRSICLFAYGSAKNISENLLE